MFELPALPCPCTTALDIAMDELLRINKAVWRGEVYQQWILAEEGHGEASAAETGYGAPVWRHVGEVG